MVVGLKPDLEGYFDRFSAIVIPEHRDGFIKSIEKSVNESSEWKYEGMLQKPSGETIWFSGNSFPSPREDEMVFNGIVRDITAQKQSEKALHESEQRYRTVFENTGTATVIIEPDTTISLCNSEFERLSGYTSNEIEGRKSWTEFVVREDLDRMIARHRIRRENHDQGLQEYEFRFVPRTKEVRNIYLVVDIIPDSDKSVASLTDITERKQAEEKLQKAEEKYRNIFENSTEGLYRVNPEGHFVTVNPAATSILGYESPEELIGTVTDIGSQIYVYPEDREKALEMLKKEGFFKNFEVRNRKKMEVLYGSAPTSILFGMIRKCPIP